MNYQDHEIAIMAQALFNSFYRKLEEYGYISSSKRINALVVTEKGVDASRWLPEKYGKVYLYFVQDYNIVDKMIIFVNEIIREYENELGEIEEMSEPNALIQYRPAITPYMVQERMFAATVEYRFALINPELAVEMYL